VARSSAPQGFSSEPSGILQLGFGLFSTEWTLWSSLVAQSCCSALSASLVLVAAVAEGLLCFLAAEVVGGRSISVFERINPSCSGGDESLSVSPGGGASMIVYNVTQVALSGGAAKLY